MRLPFALSACAILATGTSTDNRDRSDEPLRLLGDDLTDIYFIGDLHGDVICAREWVSKTGQIDLSSSPWKWTGEEGGALVFLGDYVDKGPDSRGVLEFVMAIETRFPDHVVAIMGNHDLFALLDAVLPPSERDRPMRVPVSSYAYSFLHPQEFVDAGWSPPRDDDDEILSELLTHLQSVYAKQSAYPMMSEVIDNMETTIGSKTFNNSSSPDATLSARARARYALWLSEYAAGLVSSGLADWLAQRPLVAAVGDALVVHAGLPFEWLQLVLDGEDVEDKEQPASFIDAVPPGATKGVSSSSNAPAIIESSPTTKLYTATTGAFRNGLERARFAALALLEEPSPDTNTEIHIETSATSRGKGVPALKIETGVAAGSALFPLGAHSLEGGFSGLLGGSKFRAALVGNLVQYRGHLRAKRPRQGSGKAGSQLGGCAEVDAVLHALNQPLSEDHHGNEEIAENGGFSGGHDESARPHHRLQRIVVGHTPDDEVRMLCGGALVAGDSALSRPFRAFGNHYCPVVGIASHTSSVLSAPLLAGVANKPRPGSGCEEPLVDRCEGSISHLHRASPLDPWPLVAGTLSIHPVNKEMKPRVLMRAVLGMAVGGINTPAVVAAIATAAATAISFLLWMSSGRQKHTTVA